MTTITHRDSAHSAGKLSKKKKMVNLKYIQPPRNKPLRSSKYTTK
jgi:hypothetical protein